MNEKAVDRATLIDFVKDDLVDYFYEIEPYAELVGDVLLETPNNTTDLILRANDTKAEAKVTLEQFLDYDWLNEDSQQLTISAVMKGEQAAKDLAVVMRFDIGLPDSGGLIMNSRLFVMEAEKMAAWETLFINGDLNYLMIFEFLVGLTALIFVIFEIQDFFTGKRADDLALRTFWKALSWVSMGLGNGFRDSSLNLQLDDEDTNFGEERKKEYKRVWASARTRWRGGVKNKDGGYKDGKEPRKLGAMKYFVYRYSKVMYGDYIARFVRYWSKDGKILDFVQILSMLFWVTMRALNFWLHMRFDFSKGNMGFGDDVAISVSHDNWKWLAIYHDMEVKFLALACLVIFVSIFKVSEGESDDERSDELRRLNICRAWLRAPHVLLPFPPPFLTLSIPLLRDSLHSLQELRLFPTLGPQLRTTTKTVISSEVLFFTFLLIYLLLGEGGLRERMELGVKRRRAANTIQCT